MANTTWSPTDKAAGISLSGGNLIATSSGSGNWVRTAHSQTGGKYYWEVTAATFTNASSAVGLATGTANLTSGAGAVAGTAFLTRSGLIYIDTIGPSISLGAITSGTVVCFAVDLTAKLIWFRSGAAGPWNNNATYSPAAGTGGVSIPSIGGAVAGFASFFGSSASEVGTLNSGDTAFAGVVPSGFTAGLPAPPTSAQATLVVSEQWIMPRANAQATQVLLEMWAPGGTTQPRAVATLVALEQWASSGLAIAATQPTRVWILA